MLFAAPTSQNHRGCQPLRVGFRGLRSQHGHPGTDERKYHNRPGADLRRPGAPGRQPIFWLSVGPRTSAITGVRPQLGGMTAIRTQARAAGSESPTSRRTLLSVEVAFPCPPSSDQRWAMKSKGLLSTTIRFPSHPLSRWWVWALGAVRVSAAKVGTPRRGVRFRRERTRGPRVPTEAWFGGM